MADDSTIAMFGALLIRYIACDGVYKHVEKASVKRRRNGVVIIDWLA